MLSGKSWETSATWRHIQKFVSSSKMLAAISFVRKFKVHTSRWLRYFSLSVDGSKEIIGKEVFFIDETLIAKVTELPSTGDWFKTTITKDVEFRSYLKPEHRGVVWKKSVPSSWL